MTIPLTTGFTVTVEPQEVPSGFTAFDGNVSLVIEAAFGNTARDLIPPDEYSWVDITTDCREIVDMRRGRNHILDRIEAGILRLAVDNRAGTYTPTNTSSTRYPYVRPGCPLRVRAHYSGTTYTLWTGYAESWTPRFPATGKDALVDVIASDAIKQLAQARTGRNYGAYLGSLSNVEAWWRFDELTGLTVADETGNAHTLTFDPTPQRGLVGGLGNSDLAWGFDGTEDGATVASDTALEIDTDRSIQGWFRPGAFLTTGRFPIVSIEQIGQGQLTGLWYDFAESRFFGSYRDAVIFTPVAAKNEWHHVAVTYDKNAPAAGSTSVTVWLNGVKGPTYILPTLTASSPITTIGYKYPDTTKRWRGHISELSFHTAVLSGSEIRNLAYGVELGASELTTDRFDDVVTSAGMPALVSVPYAGITTMPAAPDIEQTNALALVRQAENAENGLFLATTDGLLEFRHRYYRAFENLTSEATFDDLGVALPYSDIVMSYDDDQIYNDITVDMGAVGESRLVDFQSISLYGLRPLERSVALTNTNEGDDAASYLLARYATPRMRIRSITVNPQHTSAAWPAVLSLDIGSRITVTRTLPGDDFTEEMIIEGVIHTFDPRSKRWTTIWQLDQADQGDFWLLGVAGQSELGSTTILNY